MGRRRRHVPLRVLLNNRLVGHLTKAPSGAVTFRYAPSWLEWTHALPVSLSLPLREDPYHGAPVVAVFDNLLPDADALRRRVAEQVGAAGTDAYSLLAAIGGDCVGALQFIPDDDHHPDDGAADPTAIVGEPLDDTAIEQMLAGLTRAPLGLDREDPFRISMAGAQEKTALLWRAGQWIKPHGATPTTHILKTQIGHLQNGIDLSNSVENEYYCLKLAGAFGLPVNPAEMQVFGRTKALVIERFDRHWTQGGRLLRIPQEDCCQALGIPPVRKYESDGGPRLVDILELLSGSDTPETDRTRAFMAQILFWLIGATDGHAKNFSMFLFPGGRYRLTPLYDILTAQPSLEARQIEPKQMKLALSVGSRRHYRTGEILGRHFQQTGKEAGLPDSSLRDAIDCMAARARSAFDRVEEELPRDFPKAIHESVKNGVLRRIERGIF